MDRFIEFALVAAREALTQAGWSPASAAEQERTATVIATGIGGSARSPMRYIPPMNAGRVASRRSLSPLFWPTGRRACVYRPRLPGPHRRAGHRLRSGCPAIGDAARMIRSGEADIALCGGAEAAIHRVSWPGLPRQGAVQRPATSRKALPAPLTVTAMVL